MIPALVPRGYGHGSGAIDPTHSRFILNIPKNASSYIFDWAGRFGWKAAVLEHNPQILEMIVILRDPVERWISGISQYICTYIQSVHGPNGPVFDEAELTEHDYFISADQFIEQYTDLTERILFDSASRFDDHVWPQCEIVEGLGKGAARTYFMVGKNLTTELSEYLGFPVLEDLDRNSGKDNPEQRKIQEFLHSRLKKRPELRQRLVRHYQTDYSLIDSVNFYGSRDVK